MITPEKIEEWIKEVEQRSSSAPLILRYIANRLRDLSERNEELLAENIALRTRERVEEYERRISSLEYQLDLLRRQFGGELPTGERSVLTESPAPAQVTSAFSVLIYDTLGHVLRIQANLDHLTSGETIARLDLGAGYDPEKHVLRLLLLPDTEELLFVFTSGRVEAMPLEDIPATNLDATDGGLVDWQRVGQPAPTYATEALACLAAVSRMALKEYFVQVSRRGYVKKMKTAMAESILSNRYIGTGVKQPADQTFNLLLCRNEDRLTLVSWEGYVLNVEINALPVSTEEVMRLGPRDHLVSAFLSPAEHATLVMTDNAKAIHRTEEFLESTLGLRQKGKGIYSQRRREEGVRVVGGGAVREQDWGFTLHRDGSLTQHSVQDLLSSGAIQSSDKLLAFSTLKAPRIQNNRL